MRIFQKGFNYSQDGPGNRLVYHLQGCNMRCKWCSNPEGMSLDGGWETTVEDLVIECRRSQRLFFDGGGVTFTGGEATVQFEELKQVLTRLKEMGIHTALETNGTHPELPLLWDLVDVLMMDFKHYDDEMLKRFTGMGNATVKRNFEAACERAKPILIRIPLIRGVNDDPDGFTAYFCQFQTDRVTFEFLPYHEYGREKWRSRYEVEDGFIDARTLRHFRHRFEECGLRLVRT